MATKFMLVPEANNDNSFYDFTTYKETLKPNKVHRMVL